VSPQQYVKVVNPLNPEHTHMSKSHADRLKRQHLGDYDEVGRFVHKPRNEKAAASQQHRVGHNARFDVEEYTGQDARPGMPVLPPSPDVVRRERHKDGRIPVRPPMKPKSVHSDAN
jgi:hypothetical protein